MLIISRSGLKVKVIVVGATSSDGCLVIFTFMNREETILNIFQRKCFVGSSYDHGRLNLSNSGRCVCD